MRKMRIVPHTVMRELRVINNLSQEALAGLTGYSQAWVSQLETRRSIATEEEANIIAEHLKFKGYPLECLFWPLEQFVEKYPEAFKESTKTKSIDTEYKFAKEKQKYA